MPSSVNRSAGALSNALSFGRKIPEQRMVERRRELSVEKQNVLGRVEKMKNERLMAARKGRIDLLA